MSKEIVLHGHVLDAIKQIPDGSVHCVVTSPPYWGLRNYGTEPQVWPDSLPLCETHDWSEAPPRRKRKSTDVVDVESKQATNAGAQHDLPTSNFCRRCNAWRGELGLEPTPELYVKHMVEIFREVRRVLRKDGTLWLNLGSSYSSEYIESERYVLRTDLTKEEYATVFKTLSEVWQANVQAESAVSPVLVEGGTETDELHNEELPSLQERIYKTQESTANLLLSGLCEIGKTNEKENKNDSSVRGLPEAAREAQIGNQKESGGESFLQHKLLVSVQPEGEPLFMGGRTAREDEPRGAEVAQSGDKKRQGVLPSLPFKKKVGSSPHTTVQNSQEGTVENQQWNNSVSRLPHQTAQSGAGILSNSIIYSLYSYNGLALNRSAIPKKIIKYFKPEYILKPKDDCSIPARVALALQADGWWLRSDIIFHKPNPMPESVTDRPTKSHEYIFLLTKSDRYFYDAAAIYEPYQSELQPPRDRSTEGYNKSFQGGRWSAGQRDFYVRGGRNRRTVWTITTEHFKGAHFATFPTDIPEICIKAGTSQKGCCPKCGAPWERIIGKGLTAHDGSSNTQYPKTTTAGRLALLRQAARERGEEYQNESRTLGWKPTCDCGEEAVIPCTVLDPFGGSGTTAEVAKRLGRDFILIELKKEYITELIEPRIGAINPLFAEKP